MIRQQCVVAARLAYAGGWVPEQPRTLTLRARAEFQKRNQAGGACQAPPGVGPTVFVQKTGSDSKEKVDGRGRKKSGAGTCVVQNRKVMRCPRFAGVFVLSFSFMLGLRVSVKKDF